jgi:thioredoxin reductase/NAD-dependent dihydropyrimidine dehydrogenase PreA subunit
MNSSLIAIYAVPIAAIFFWYLRSSRQREEAAIRAAEEAIALSMTQPPSLHPIIDPTRCIGCRSCVAACPEQASHAVLGMIRGKAHLVAPSNCIGHGACERACPAGAIKLVFGTAKRGIDIPTVQPDFQTNIPGIFIAGELGGMGLISNAVEQGRQALESIKQLDGLGQPDLHDVVIVGAGPAGIAASLGAMDAKLDYVTLEQECLGGTVAHFPRGKLVMTRPAILPVVGKVKFTETTKEELLEFWQGVERQTGLGINYKERVVAINRLGGGAGFDVVTERSSYKTRSVLLTIGRRGTPRQLGVPGEELTKVAYRLVDPEQYRGQHVLVVGGGDSALEAACSIAAEPGTTVTISYRSSAFSRAKPKNREKIASLVAQGRVKAMMNSNVREIREDAVIIEGEDGVALLPNQSIIVCAGGILPTGFLKEVGIDVETKYGTA